MSLAKTRIQGRLTFLGLGVGLSTILSLGAAGCMTETSETGEALGTESGDLTPAITLSVSQNACASNVAQNYFQVTNNTDAPIALSDLVIKYWINDTSGKNVVPAVYYGGCVTTANGTCVHQVTGAAGSATSFPACGPSATQQANWEISIASSDHGTIAPGSKWNGVQSAINLQNYGPFSPGSSTWYSGCASGKPYAPNVNFALYYQGTLISGTPPSCRAPAGD